jgi:hypothetical protein
MILLCIATSNYALFEAILDYNTIRAGKPIHHKRAWMRRALIGGCLALCFGSLRLTVPIVAFLFSAVFRLALNYLRGRNPLYIAPWSNVYDRVMFSIAHPRRWRIWFSALGMNIQSILYFDSLCIKTERFLYFNLDKTGPVHRAGKVAYIIELTVVAICVYFYHLNQN